MNKTIIAPIVAVIVLATQIIFGISIPKEVVNETIVAIGNIVLIGSTIVGIVKNHRKNEEK